MQEQDNRITSNAPSGDAGRWQRIRANKINQRTAAQLERVRTGASDEHKQVLRGALKLWAKAAKLSKKFPDAPDLLSAEGGYHLMYCDTAHNTRHERSIVVDVARAITEGKTVEQCAQLFKSKVAYYKGITDRWHEWEEASERGEPRPLPPDTDGILDAEIIYTDDDILSADILAGVSKKPTRRIPVTVKRFEKYGILRGDTAIVVMDGDIRAGELGYFAIACDMQHNPAYYNHFAFVCEQDATCHEWPNNGPLTPESLCLRHEDIRECNGHHNAQVHGRVCAVERKRQAVETTLKLRPFDGRM
ncbi:MAG: hypothetical protein WBP93_18400 [Pyrinomonadaceae bacterium]